MAEHSVLTLRIEGMTCASCVNRAERALKAVPGVQEVRVNLATSKAYIAAGNNAVALVPKLLAAIAKAGYEGFTAQEDEAHDPAARQAALARREGWELCAALALSLPLVLPMLGTPFGQHWMLPAAWQFALATPVQFWLGARFYRSGWKALRAGSGNMELLVALGTSAAYGLSLVTWWQQREGMPHLYVESAAMVIALVRLGKWLEARAKVRTLSALTALQGLKPALVRILHQGKERDVPLAALCVGDVMVVRPGERLATDGVVVAGHSAVDESMLTGESLPVLREEGHAVVGGSLNGDGALQVRATAVGAQTQLAQIVALVENAQSRKPAIQQLVDKVSAVFVPAVLGIALLTWLAWGLAGGDWTVATLNAVAVLVIACPCALGLATPATLMVGTGLAAQRGILVRDPQALEAMKAVRVVAFDKTGTLTQGQPQLTDVVPAPGQLADALLATAAALQAQSEHPLAQAVLQAAATKGLAPVAASAARSESGRGMEAVVGDALWRLASARWKDEMAPADPDPALMAQAKALAEQGHSVSWLLCQTAAAGSDPAAGTWQVRGLLAFADTPKPEAAACVAALHREGVRSVLISGDNAGAAQALATKVGIAEVHANVLPADKAALVDALRKATPAPGKVAMVGDGVNDAPALAAADVGLAMGSGTDVAVATAGLTLLRGDPRLVVEALQLSRAISAKLHQNLFWAFGYNVVGVPLAALGGLNPVWAGAAMALSSVSVITNALWLARWKPSL